MNASNLLPLAGVAIFAYLVFSIDLGAVAYSLLGMDPLLFLASLAVMALVVLVRAWKWGLLAGAYGSRYTFSQIMKAWSIGFSIGMITPGKVGELSKSCYLGKDSVGRSLTSVAADRIIDLFILFILALVGISLFVQLYMGDTAIAYTTYALFAVFIIAVVLLSEKRMVSLFLRPLYLRLAPRKHRALLKSLYSDFYGGIGALKKSKKRLALNVLLTLSSWLLTVLFAFLLSLSLSLPLSYSFLLMVIPAVNLVLVLPISFSGLGTRDATMVFFLSFVGLSPEAVLPLSLAMLVANYLVAIPGFWWWHRNPLLINGRC